MSSVNWDKILKFRKERINDQMKKYDVDVLFLTTPPQVRYVTNWDGCRTGKTVFALVPRDKPPILLVPTVDVQDAKDSARGFEVKSVALKPTDIVGVVEDALAEQGIREGKLGLESGVVGGGFGFLSAMQQMMPKVEVVSAGPILNNAEEIKHDEEVKVVRQSAAISAKAMKAVMDAAKPGMRECELCAIWMREVLSESGGYDRDLGYGDVQAGRNAAVYAWGVDAEGKLLRDGESFWCDLGFSYKGVPAEIARTKILGKPRRKETIEIHKALHKAHRAGIKALKPGVSSRKIGAILHKSIDDSGFSRWKIRGSSMGHGAGPAYQPPIIGDITFDFEKMQEAEYIDANDRVLKKNMIIHTEPGIAAFNDVDVGGVRVEDVILITDTGSEVLTNLEYYEDY